MKTDDPRISDAIAIIGGAIGDDSPLAKVREQYGQSVADAALRVRDEIRNKVYNALWMAEKQVTSEEIEKLFYSVIDSEYSKYDRKSLSSILGYLGWLCWHEGILKQ